MVVTFQVQVDPLDEDRTFDTSMLQMMYAYTKSFAKLVEQLAGEYTRTGMFVDGEVWHEGMK